MGVGRVSRRHLYGSLVLWNGFLWEKCEPRLRTTRATAWTNNGKRAEQGDGTAVTPSGHFWDCMYWDLFCMIPNTRAQGVCYGKNWLHGATMQHSSTTWAKCPNGFWSMNPRLVRWGRGWDSPDSRISSGSFYGVCELALSIISGISSWASHYCLLSLIIQEERGVHGETVASYSI